MRIVCFAVFCEGLVCRLSEHIDTLGGRRTAADRPAAASSARSLVEYRGVVVPVQNRGLIAILNRTNGCLPGTIPAHPYISTGVTPDDLGVSSRVLRTARRGVKDGVCSCYR